MQSPESEQITNNNQNDDQNDDQMKEDKIDLDEIDDDEKEEETISITSPQKLILIHGYLRKECTLIISSDIVELIYYFYDTALQRSYLSSYYYCVHYISRPFGISFCQELDKKYICFVMPNSPNGKLGLRAGSKVIGFNNFVFDENDIQIINRYFVETQNKQFTVNNNIISYSSNDSCFPLTLYLKYDPIDALNKIDEKENKNNEYQKIKCKFTDNLHEELLRWAIQGKVEYYKVDKIDGLQIFSMLPLQSKIIRNNILQKINDINILQQDDEKDDDMNKKWDNIISDCTKYDDYYFKVGAFKYDDIIKVYGKAGCYLYVVSPIKGWIKFIDTDNGSINVSKCEDVKLINDEFDDDENDAPLSEESKYDIELAILTKYIRQSELSQHLNINISDDEADDFDRCYSLMDIVEAIQNKKNGLCFKLIYFMNTMNFIKTIDKTQQNHIKKLINITNKFNENVELVIITIHHNIYGDYNAKLPIFIDGYNREITQYIVGRISYLSLKQFMTGYDSLSNLSLFKFGLLFLGTANQIFIKPNEIMDDIAFRKINYLINGRRLSKLSNLLRGNSFLSRTLSVD